MSILSSFRNYGAGKINESALAANNVPDDDIREYEEDEQFMQEATAICLPMMIQGMLMEDAADAMDESVKEAFATIQNYMVGQGLISEAATVSLSNPKINIVRMNKDAQISRLTSIFILKMGRKAGHKAYKKYKLGQKIKKTNMEELRKIYGAKAERLAKKLWAKTRKNNKVAAVVDSHKGNKK